MRAILTTATITLCLSTSAALAQIPGVPIVDDPVEPETPDELIEEDDEAPAYESTVIGRRMGSPLESSRSLTVVDEESMRERPAATMGDLLDEEPGIHTQTTNRGAGAPFIRGHVGPGNLIVFDGIRFNNGTFRTGPNQYLNLFDPVALGQIEVLRGPSGVLYGSDAIGGVMHLRPRLPAYGSGVETRTLLGFRSADSSYVLAPEANWGDESVSSTAGVTVDVFNTLRTGDDGGEVPGSAYQQFSPRLSLSTLFQPETELRVSYFGRLIRHAGRVDRLPANNFRRYDNDNHLAYLRLSHLGSGAFEEVTATLSMNRLNEAVRRNDCLVGDVYGLTDGDGDAIETTLDTDGCLAGDLDAIRRRRSNIDQTLTLGTSLAVVSDLPVDGLSLLWGVDAYQAFVDSSRVDFNVVGDPAELERSEQDRGNYSNDSGYGTYGAYLVARHDVSLNETMTLRPEAGVRVSHVRASAPDVPELGDVDYDFTGATGNARVSLLVEDTATVYVGWAQGFRAPNLQETTVLGDTGDFFEVPNDELGPERSNEIEVGARAELGPVGLSLAGFYDALSDLMTRRPTTFEGLSQVGGVEVRERFNAESATFVGVEASVSVDIYQGLSARGNVAWIRTEVEAEGETTPARREPPLRWMGALRYGATFYPAFIEVVANGAATQDRLSPGDERDIRICGSDDFPGVLLGDLGSECGGTEGWIDLGLRAGVDVGDSLLLRASLSNLLDSRYRMHGSGTDAPGFGLSTSATVMF